ncbi:hypothetical protein V6N12_032466 [Hibiscus sabdariffa]|uniref:RNase H type-1 domain-containing protein n=1 Tax=Hibiscus sabdariffa TaxID=183260 RepID=A0ABR2CDH2_9ROSI
MENRLVFSCIATTPPTPIVVCDMVDINGNWNWRRFSSILPQGVLDRLVAIKPHYAVFGQDLPGFRQVQLETDNLDVARILQGSSDALVGCSLVDAILMILARQWTVFVRHITRDQNLVADRVVALCWDPSIGSRDFDLVPDALNDLVRKEVEAG